VLGVAGPAEQIDCVAAATAFSGMVLVELDGEEALACTRDLADRRHEIPKTIEAQLGIASGTKGLTAAAVVGLGEDGVLDLATKVRASSATTSLTTSLANLGTGRASGSISRARRPLALHTARCSCTTRML
jgi:DNA mismatch repair protein MutH